MNNNLNPRGQRIVFRVGDVASQEEFYRWLQIRGGQGGIPPQKIVLSPPNLSETKKNNHFLVQSGQNWFFLGACPLKIVFLSMPILLTECKWQVHNSHDSVALICFQDQTWVF